MTLLPPPGKGQVMAVGLLLVALGLFYMIALHWFVAEHLELSATIDDLQQSELKFRRAAAGRPQLEQRLAEVRAFEAANNLFLPEESFDLAAASLSSTLKTIISNKASDAQRCQVISSQNERPAEVEPYQRVTIQVRLRCDLDDLAKILHELESATPVLFVDELNLYQQPDLSGSLVAPNLGAMDARFDLSGYIRKPGGQG